VVRERSEEIGMEGLLVRFCDALGNVFRGSLEGGVLHDCGYRGFVCHEAAC
jgi:hypothetical protein